MCARHAAAQSGLTIDFVKLLSQRKNLSKNQLIARAVGRRTRTVIDATAGLGNDSVMLAAMGYYVTAIERSAVVAKLLSNALGLALQDSQTAKRLADRMTIMKGDSKRILENITTRPDAIYMDPMFPPKRKKSALEKKELRILRELTGNDDDADELLEIARKHAHRVVVKRPDDALPLAPNFTISFPGKLVRYDVYVQAGISA